MVQYFYKMSVKVHWDLRERFWFFFVINSYCKPVLNDNIIGIDKLINKV